MDSRRSIAAPAGRRPARGHRLRSVLAFAAVGFALASPGAERALESYVAGAVIGPYLGAASSEAVAADGVVVGGLVVNRMPSDDDSPGGPWVTEVFVEPSAQGRGVGRALFARTVGELRAAGESSLRLAVQVDNPAQHLYASLGFEVISRWSRIRL